MVYLYRIRQAGIKCVLVSDGQGRECYTVYAEDADGLENWSLAFGPLPVVNIVLGEWKYDDAVTDLATRAKK